MPKSDSTPSAKKGDLVRVHFTLLQPGERAENLPEVTRAIPYEGWIKGFLIDDQAEIGQTVQIETFIGRQFSGVLAEVNPVYDHHFGEPQPEFNSIGIDAWKKLDQEENL